MSDPMRKQTVLDNHAQVLTVNAARTVAPLQRSRVNTLAKPVRSTFIQLQSLTADSRIDMDIEVSFKILDSAALSIVGRIPPAWRGIWKPCAKTSISNVK